MQWAALISIMSDDDDDDDDGTLTRNCACVTGAAAAVVTLGWRGGIEEWDWDRVVSRLNPKPFAL